MINIVILGCGHIAERIALGIQYSKGNLYGIASRDKQKAASFAQKHHISHIYSYEEAFHDPAVDLIYIATANPTHVKLAQKALSHQKHVIIEKPLAANSQEIKELFEIAKQNHCFLMEAHKTCFTPLQQELLKRVHEIGPIHMINAQYCAKFNEENLKEWNVEEKMGGSFYDVGVYPICFAHLYSQSPIKRMNFHVNTYKNFDCDFECQCQIEYENGILATLKSSWLNKEENKGILIGEKGSIEVTDFWKNTEAKIVIQGHEERIEVNQKSDFTGEIDHAIDCIQKGLLQSPIMSESFSIHISLVLEEMKRQRKKTSS